MRASVNKNDPGYMNWAINRGLRVFFEGAETHYVVTADEEQRMIIQFELDKDGRPVFDHEVRSLKRVTRYGHVRIELPQKASGR